MNHSQRRPKNLALTPLRDTEVSTENAASSFLPAWRKHLRPGIARRKAASKRTRKVLVFSAACGFLSLATIAPSALSQETVAPRILQPSSSQTTQQSELILPAKLGDLEDDVPQATPMKATAPTLPHGMGPRPLLPQTFHDKFMEFAVTTAGPRALFGPAFPAAIRMANPPSHFPAEWRQGAEAFGRNYGDQLATVATLQTTRFVFGAALHEDLRYHPSTSTNFFMRTGHALTYTFVDRSDSGHARVAVSNFAGLAAGGYVGTSYLPNGFDDVAHADQRIVFQFSRLAGSNLGAEFGPDIFRFLAEHHIPRPKIPIPEWWVKR
jgi:hypothetical protein